MGINYPYAIPVGFTAMGAVNISKITYFTYVYK